MEKKNLSHFFENYFDEQLIPQVIEQLIPQVIMNTSFLKS